MARGSPAQHLPVKILCVFGRNAYGDAARGEGYEHANFLPALRALGHETLLLDSFDRAAYRDFAELNRAFLQSIELQRPDVILCVLMSYDLWSETLDRARALSPGPIINWGTDDSWKYEQFVAAGAGADRVPSVQAAGSLRSAEAVYSGYHVTAVRSDR